MLAALRGAGLAAGVRLAEGPEPEFSLAGAVGVYDVVVPIGQTMHAERILAAIEARDGTTDWQTISPAPTADEGQWNGPGVVWREEDRWTRHIGLVVYVVLLVGGALILLLL
jgi:hypothetical protein